MVKKLLKQQFNNVKETSPLVHNITNYVTVNDCANILLAIGASPIMADDIQEVEDITRICTGLNINIGTLNARTIEAMIAAGKKSNELNHPILLDPVGAGASGLRTKTAKVLLENIQFTAIRGNISEIKTLAMGTHTTNGVDANISDTVNEENLDQTIAFLKAFSQSSKSIVVVTGAIDIVTDGHQAYVIRNGHPMMTTVTGTGCMLSALITAFISANQSTPLEASAAAVITMGLAGELAYDPKVGNASYRHHIIDQICLMTDEILENGGKYEVRS